jgi:hypothetical protein
VKVYKTDDPVFSEEIYILEVGDPGYAELVNKAPTQLLQNVLIVRQEATALKGQLEEIDTDLAGMIEDAAKAQYDLTEVTEVVAKVQYDLTEVAFQLAVADMIDSSALQNVIVDSIDSESSVQLASGSYASGKVYI